MNTAKKKWIAVAIGLLFVFVTFASFFYIVKEENHDCTGEDCPICACIHEVEQTLRNLGTGRIQEHSVIIMPVLTGVLLFACMVSFFPVSLVSQKVRLND